MTKNKIKIITGVACILAGCMLESKNAPTVLVFILAFIGSCCLFTLDLKRYLKRPVSKQHESSVNEKEIIDAIEQLRKKKENGEKLKITFGDSKSSK